MKSSLRWNGLSLLLGALFFANTSEAKAPCVLQNLAIENRNPHDNQLAFDFRGDPSGIPAGFPRTNFRTVSDVNNFFGSNAATEDDAISVICTPDRSLEEVVTF